MEQQGSCRRVADRSVWKPFCSFPGAGLVLLCACCYPGPSFQCLFTAASPCVVLTFPGLSYTCSYAHVTLCHGLVSPSNDELAVFWGVVHGWFSAEEPTARAPALLTH